MKAYIMRGIPGSGKSFIAQALASKSKSSVVHSTDFYFYNDKGEYVFDPSLLGEHHAANLEAFTRSCEKGVGTVICDNTNILLEHYDPYVEVAEENGYSVRIITVDGVTPEEAFELNTHGVPLGALQRMCEAL